MVTTMIFAIAAVFLVPAFFTYRWVALRKIKRTNQYGVEIYTGMADIGMGTLENAGGCLSLLLFIAGIMIAGAGVLYMFGGK